MDNVNNHWWMVKLVTIQDKSVEALAESFNMNGKTDRVQQYNYTMI